ncbi:hypothetical protein LIER_07047 [Lithospermum erythrorhizon]|uniref:Uncharacterized protein n=1 Tax=Lithospermum erythrorhizon TaxID=34254 RepID=A0AAV3P7J9_LITER
MSIPSTTVKLAFAAISLSFAAASTTSPSFLNPHSTSSPPHATTSDLLNILGPIEQSSLVNAQLSQQLWSCFKFLVPFSKSQRSTHRSLSSCITPEEEVDQLIYWPPAPVMELARLAVDSGGYPDSIHRALDPIPITVPDVEGCKEYQCELTRTPYGRRFINEELNSYLESLFKVILERGPSVGLNVSLARYDLFHGHLFIAVESRRLGILFHAKEYPAYDKKVFPYNMGYCQIGSNVEYDDEMNLRNILWLAPLPSDASNEWLAPGVLVVLDAHPGGIIYRDLIPEYVHIARTLYEDDFGEVVVDVNYLNVGDDKVPNYQLFIC